MRARTEHQVFVDALRECLGLEPLYRRSDPRRKFVERFGFCGDGCKRAPTLWSDRVRRAWCAKIGGPS